MTMQRMKRGDMSRLNHKNAEHTDVYQPAPVAAKVVASPAGDAQGRAHLQNQLHQAHADNKLLASKLAEAETALAAPAPEHDESEELAKLREQYATAVARYEEADSKVTELGNVLTEAQAKVVELETQEPAEASEPVNTVKVTTVNQVRSKGNTMRVDCTVEPTDGPLKQEVALYLTLEEGAKLRPEEEKEDAEDEPVDDAE